MKQLAMEEANDGTTGSSGGASEQNLEGKVDISDPEANEPAKEKEPESPATEGATSTAPVADEGAAAPAASYPGHGPQFTPGAVALVTKGIDRLPVELRDQAHLDSLISEHGSGSVEVQS